VLLNLSTENRITYDMSPANTPTSILDRGQAMGKDKADKNNWTLIGAV
jgi:hypothetical protein